MKKCTKCGELKDTSCYSKQKASKDGLQAWCKECKKTHTKTWLLDKPNYGNEASRKNREKDLGASAAENTRTYQAKKAGLLASDANREVILSFYKKAAELSSLTGLAHVVDHIIPLGAMSSDGKIIGWHHENNLQVITCQENILKGKRDELDYPNRVFVSTAS